MASFAFEVLVTAKPSLVSRYTTGSSLQYIDRSKAADLSVDTAFTVMNFSRSEEVGVYVLVLLLIVLPPTFHV